MAAARPLINIGQRLAGHTNVGVTTGSRVRRAAAAGRAGGSTSRVNRRVNAARGSTIPGSGRPIPMGARAGGGGRGAGTRAQRARVVQQRAAQGTRGSAPISMGPTTPTGRVGGPRRDTSTARQVTGFGRFMRTSGRMAAWGAAGLGGIGLGYSIGPNSGTGRGMSGSSSMYGSSGANGAGRVYG